jgi:hypothetical protein
VNGFKDKQGVTVLTTMCADGAHLPVQLIVQGAWWRDCACVKLSTIGKTDVVDIKEKYAQLHCTHSESHWTTGTAHGVVCLMTLLVVNSGDAAAIRQGYHRALLQRDAQEAGTRRTPSKCVEAKGGEQRE